MHPMDIANDIGGVFHWYSSMYMEANGTGHDSQIRSCRYI